MADKTIEDALAAVNARMSEGNVANGEAFFAQIARHAGVTDAQQHFSFRAVTLLPQDARDILAFLAVQGFVVAAVPLGEAGSLNETPPEPAKPKLPAGWGFPGSSRKAHYFAEGSLDAICGKYGWFMGEREEGNDIHSANCVDCMRRVAKMRAKEGAQ